MMSLSATAAVILLAYPMAYFLAFRVKRHKMIWLMAITLPFWTSYLLRVFSWKLMLGFGGVINSGLIKLGFINEPLEFLLYNPIAVVITLENLRPLAATVRWQKGRACGIAFNQLIPFDELIAGRITQPALAVLGATLLLLVFVGPAFIRNAPPMAPGMPRNPSAAA